MPIYRKGNREHCKNYRGMNLLYAEYKLYAKIISRRISVISEPLLSEEQNGFRRGRSCMESIFTIQQLLERHREYNTETYLLFIDYVKAFDSVVRKELWEIRAEKGFPRHLIRIAQSMY
jgi:hypothetical protein